MVTTRNTKAAKEQHVQSCNITLKDGTQLVLIATRRETSLTMAVLAPPSPALRALESPLREESARALAMLDASQLLPEGGWFLNRLIVNDEAYRGKGIGGEVLERLKRFLSREPGRPYIIVTPSGYGTDPERRLRFYLSNGFVPAEGEYTGALVWRPEAQE